MNKESENNDLAEFHWMTVLLQNIDVGIIVLNRNYQVQVWNTFMENHSGVHPQEMRNKNLLEAFPEIPESWFKRKCESVFQLQHHAFNTWHEKPYLFKFKNYRPITNPEKYMYQNFTIFPITSLNGLTEFIAIVIYDVTDTALSKKELEKSNRALTQQSRTDQLTSLYNRWYWELRLEQEFERYKRYENKSTLIMLDIDNFKKVNDSYGHPAGDAVIRELAKTISKMKRNTDIAGRYGGEEFAILLVDTNIGNACIFAERLRKIIETSTVKQHDLELKYSISLGMAEFNNAIDSHEIIVKMADEALYNAKAKGRNQYAVYGHPPLAAVSSAEKISQSS